MFVLVSEDFGGRILDCAGGPASFNVEASRQGCILVSCDPLYRVTADQIHNCIERTHNTSVEVNQDRYVWDEIEPPTRLVVRDGRASMLRFLYNFQRSPEEGRYHKDELPSLGFSDGDFHLALCSPTPCPRTPSSFREVFTSPPPRRCAASPGKHNLSTVNYDVGDFPPAATSRGRAASTRVQNRDEARTLRIPTRRKPATVELRVAFRLAGELQHGEFDL
jgi:hypothetical protein